MEVYIDESGDEGTKGAGTRWLVFGCVIVQYSELPEVVRGVNTCVQIASKAQTVPRPLHFKKLTHADKRGATRIFADSSWDGVVVASDTTKILPGSALSKPKFQYNYPLRYVIERVSWKAKEVRRIPTIYIENRRNFDLADFKRYMRLLKSRKDERFEWDYLDLDRIFVSTRNQKPALCVADGLAHAMFKAVEPDPWWGHHETTYLETLLRRLWCGSQAAGHNGLFDCGLVMMPTTAWGQFVQQYPWLPELRGKVVA